MKSNTNIILTVFFLLLNSFSMSNSYKLRETEKCELKNDTVIIYIDWPDDYNTKYWIHNYFETCNGKEVNFYFIGFNKIQCKCQNYTECSYSTCYQLNSFGIDETVCYVDKYVTMNKNESCVDDSTSAIFVHEIVDIAVTSIFILFFVLAFIIDTSQLMIVTMTIDELIQLGIYCIIIGPILY
jgi:hypothetical protein